MLFCSTLSESFKYRGFMCLRRTWYKAKRRQGKWWRVHLINY